MTSVEGGVLIAVLAAGLGALGQWLVQRFVLSRTRERERDMHRATLAAAAFGDFFAVVGRSRTVKGALESRTANPEGIDWEAEFVRTIDDLHAARGRLAAVAGPPVIAKLAKLERTEGGFSANAEEGRQLLTEIMQLLRADLGVDGGTSFCDLQAVLLGSKKELRGLDAGTHRGVNLSG